MCNIDMFLNIKHKTTISFQIMFLFSFLMIIRNCSHEISILPRSISLIVTNKLKTKEQRCQTLPQRRDEYSCRDRTDVSCSFHLVLFGVTIAAAVSALDPESWNQDHEQPRNKRFHINYNLVFTVKGQNDCGYQGCYRRTWKTKI